MPYAVPLLLISALMLVVSALAWQQRRQPMLALYAGVSLFSALWHLSVALEILWRNWAWRVAMVRLRPLIITLLCTCFFLLMVEYAGVLAYHRRRLSLGVTWLAVAVGLATLLGFGRGWVFYNLRMGATPPYRVNWDVGPLGGAYLAFLYVLLLGGFVALWSPAARRGPAYRRNAAILTVASLLPTLGDLLFQFRLTPWPEMNVATYGNLVSNLAWMWVVFGYRAFDLIPLGRTAVLDHMRDLVFIVDAEGRLVDVNAAAAEALGDPTRNWIGREISVLPAPWADVLSGRVGSAFGQAGRDYHVTCESLRHRNGAAVGSLVLLHDITDIKRAEQRLTEAHHLEMIGRLAGGVAHGFNNHLTVILGHAALLGEFKPDPEALAASLDAIEGAGRDAAALTAQLLSLSRRQMLHPTVVDVNNVILGVEKLLRQVLGGRVRLALKLAPDLPPVSVDRQQFERTFLELGLNARDAMPQGGRLTISSSALDGQVRIVLSDDGPGIEKGVLEHVFEPFFTTKDRALHSGLGLSVAHGFIHQSGGRLEVDSLTGAGAGFTITLPPGGVASAASAGPQNAG